MKIYKSCASLKMATLNAENVACRKSRASRAEGCATLLLPRRTSLKNSCAHLMSCKKISYISN